MEKGHIFADIKDEYNYLILEDKIEQVTGQRLSQMQQSFGINISNKLYSLSDFIIHECERRLKLLVVGQRFFLCQL